MATERIEGPAKVIVELDMTAFVAHVWDDEDGDVVDTTASHSLQAQVIERVAQLIRKDISADVRNVVGLLIEAKVGEIVEETLNGEFHLVSEYGSAGPRTTVRDQIGKSAREYLNKRDRYNSKTNIEAIVDKQVQEAIVKDFTKIMKEERAKVSAKLQAAAATLLAKEMGR